MSNRAITSSLLNSESAVTRVAANFAVGSVSEVGAGVGTRFVGGILTNGGNIKEAAAQAINPQSILFDAALGGAMSGVQGLQKPQQNNISSSFDRINTDIDSIECPEGIWQKGAVERGDVIDDILENNVGHNYPVIDNIDERGIVTSVKSRDLSCKTYQDSSKLESIIKKDVDKLADFSGRNWNGIKIKSSDISGRQLQIVVPDIELSNSQIESINNAIDYANAKDIKIILTVGK